MRPYIRADGRPTAVFVFLWGGQASPRRTEASLLPPVNVGADRRVCPLAPSPYLERGLGVRKTCGRTGILPVLPKSSAPK